VEVEVVRSARRRKTVSARQVGGVLRVSIPAWMSRADEARYVEDFVRRFERRSSTARVDLDRRAAVLARRHGLPEPRSIRWVDNQRLRWGSCTPADGSVRISSRVAGYPPWVLDAILVHELAHLVEPGHGPAFQALVERYPLHERATGYLLAKAELGD